MSKKNNPSSFIALLIIFPIILLAALTVQTFSQHASGQPCTTNVLFFSGNFLKANGSELSYMGQKVCLYGATIYTSSGPGAPSGSWNSTNFPQRIDWDLSMAQQAHLNFIRVTDYINGASDNPYNPTVWKNMDYLLSQAQAKGIFVLMDLSSYANHLKNQNINPYDLSQDPGWWQFISFIVNRVNTYTNIAYKNTPNIAFYSVKGEVNPVGSSFPTSTTQGYLDFYTRTTNGIFMADGGKHLIEAGGLTHLNQSNSGIPWQQIFSLPHVGLASIHVYSANRLDPIYGSNDLQKTLPMVAAWAHQNNKPLDLQEYGIVNQIGDNARANAMQTIISRATQNGFAAIVYWNLGPEITPGFHYDVNSNYPLAWKAFIQGALDFYGNTQSSNIVNTVIQPIGNVIQTVGSTISGKKSTDKDNDGTPSSDADNDKSSATSGKDSDIIKK